MIKAILFDLDGVLFDTEVHDNIIMKEYLDLINSPLPRDRVKKLICPNRETDFVSEMLEGYDDGIDHDQFFHDIIGYLRAQRTRVSFKDLMFKDVPSTLKWLKDNGYKIACASSSRYEYVCEALTTAEIDKYFDVYVSGQDFSKNKPAPDCYLYCKEKLGVESQECLVVEDSPNGILSAKNAGMKVIVRNDYVLDLDQRGGDYYVDDYYGLPDIINELNK